MPAEFRQHYNELVKDVAAIADNASLFSESSLKPSLRDIEHIFDLQFRLDKFGQLKKIHGFHHDYLRAFERSGLIKVLEEKAGPGGCYWIKFELNGIVDEKTFFPAHWTREEVMRKIVEAGNNIKNIIKTDWRGTTIVRGITSEGIELELIIEPNGNLASVYPKF